VTAGELIRFLTEHLGKLHPLARTAGPDHARLRGGAEALGVATGHPGNPLPARRAEDDPAQQLRQQRGVRDQVVFIGIAQGVRKVGVDEKAFRKGHRYFTLVNDLVQGRVLYVAKDGNRRAWMD